MTSPLFILANQSEDEGNYLWLLWFVAFVPGLLIFAYHYFKAKWWEHKFLPKNGDKNSSAFMNAYICSAVLIIRLDRRDANEKRAIPHKKMLELGNDSEELWKTFDQIWDNEISERRIAKWCRANLSPAERSDLMYLLVELAMLDGSFLAREYQFLVGLMKDLKLPIRDLKSMIAAHRQRMAREEAKKQQEQRKYGGEQKQSYSRRKVASKSAKEQASEVLGVSINADAGVIKKAYRSLVKKHHPDRYAGQNETAIKAAQARFIEIQQAYEILKE